MPVKPRWIFFIILGVAGLACVGDPVRGAHPHGKEVSAMSFVRFAELSRVDHVILGINNLQNGIDELERVTGLRAVFGGAHPGRGTQNALLSLADGHYLEILAPNPSERSGVENDYLRKLASLKPAGWAVRADDLVSLQKSLRSQGVETQEVRPGARDLPDGTHLAWKTLGYSMPTRLLPFFIQWDRNTVHPSTTSPSGCRLTGLFLQDHEPEGLRKALRAARLDVEVREAQESAIHLSLACPKGNVEF